MLGAWPVPPFHATIRHARARPVTAALALLLLLTSCITARMWAGEPQVHTDDLACDAAEALPAGPLAQAQIALRLRVALDVVFLPIEVLVSIAFWLAD